MYLKNCVRNPKNSRFYPYVHVREYENYIFCVCVHVRKPQNSRFSLSVHVREHENFVFYLCVRVRKPQYLTKKQSVLQKMSMAFL